MGTRNLIAVMKDGKYVVAQYGQFDGYPEGQGVKVLKFCRRALSHKEGRRKFKNHLADVRFIDDAETKALWEGVGVVSEFATQAQSSNFAYRYPSLMRETAADILTLINKSRYPVLLHDDIAFAGDSLFCEWAYVIDLDRRTFEVFKGFNTKPLSSTERFANAVVVREATASGRTYYPVRLFCKWNLRELPTPKDFLKTCRSIARDEEMAAEKQNPTATAQVE